MLAHVLALAGLIIGSATDIDHREVPDWVNYTLLLAGLIIAAAASLATNALTPLITSVTGLAVGYLVGALMFYTGQWGGGDAKMLMGLGALLGVPLDFLLGTATTPLLIYFLITVVFAGAAYGMLWMLYLFIKQRATVVEKLRTKLRKPLLMRVRITLLVTLALLTITALAYPHIYVLLALFVLAATYLTLYVFLLAKIVEQTCFIKEQPVKKLVPGDWVVEAVVHNGKTLVPASNTGLTPKQLEQLQKHDIKHVTIKEGIPFIPSFLIAYIAAYLWWSSEAGLLFWIV